MNNISLLIKASLQTDYNALFEKKRVALELLMYLENFVKSREFQFLVIKYSDGMINKSMIDHVIINVSQKQLKLHEEIRFLNEQLDYIASQLKNE